MEKENKRMGSRPTGKEIFPGGRGVSKEVRHRLIAQPLNGIERCGFTPIPRGGEKGGVKW